MFTRTLLSVSCCIAVAQSAGATTLAHWTFDSEADFNTGVVTDVTGNGNHLNLNSVGSPGAANQAAYSSETLFGSGGAVRFNGTRNGTSGHTGEFYQTVTDAPINTMTFDQGYTIEVIFKPVNPYDPGTNRWMGMLSRSEKTDGDSPATFAISNLGEVQWQTQDADREVEQASWSPVLFTPDVTRANDDYFHVAAVNYKDDSDLWHVDLYINGFLGSRNIVNEQHNGLAYYEDSLFTVGTNLWRGNPDSPFNGLIDDIRISDTPLSPSQFTNVPEPTSLALLGLGGLLIARRRHL